MSLVPTPEVLPIARGYFDSLLLLTFPLHLILMNAMIGAMALALWAHWHKNPVSERLAYQLAKVLPLLIAFTINFGVPPLLFAQVIFGHYLYASSIIIGVYWLSVIPILLVMYYGAYVYDFKFWSFGRRGLPVLVLSGLLMLCVGFIFSNNMTLMLNPEAWKAYFTHPGGVFLNLSEPTLWPRYCHMMVGALAVGGLSVAVLSRLWQKKDAEVAALALSSGMRLFFVATCVQVILGVWFLLSLPVNVMMLFMGQQFLATVLFIVALVLVVLVLLVAWKKHLAGCAWLAVFLVYIMTFMRAIVREGYLSQHAVEQVVAAQHDYSPLMLFVITLVIGIALIAWMVKVTLQCKEY